MNILITGGSGFVGSSLGCLIKRHYPGYEVVALDNLRRRGAELNLPRLADHGVRFVHGDIRNREDLDSLDGPFNAIVEASAEPSAFAGLAGRPDYVLNTNIGGTINCLNTAVKHKAQFIFLSTSRVYPIRLIDQIATEERDSRFIVSSKQELPGISTRGIAENFPLEGYRSLYGATKLASELLITEYNHFYQLKTVINRCGVIAGPWQMGKVDQGVMVLWVARHFWKQKLAYMGYGGSGRQVRDLLDIHDLYRLVDLQLHQGDRFNGEVYNVGGGPDHSLSLCELTELCRNITGNRITIDTVPETRDGDIKLYISDTSKIRKCCGWEPRKPVGETINSIYEWIRDHEKSLKSILS